MMSCCFNVISQKLGWSVSDDSARYYYDQGWNQVMNMGNYGKSEEYYRKMNRLDPDFLIGAALLGRISTNLSEQKDLLNHINTSEEPKSSDEKLVLSVYKSLHELMIVRQEDPEKSSELVKKALGEAIEGFGGLIRKYPEEQYLISEYIETIHYWHGPAKALDSLNYFDPNEQIIFLLGYKALLYAELGKRKEALEQSDKLWLRFNDFSIPKPWAVKSQVYFELGDFEIALNFAYRGLNLDPKNVDLLRIKSAIEEKKTEY